MAYIDFIIETVQNSILFYDILWSWEKALKWNQKRIRKIVVENVSAQNKSNQTKFLNFQP